MTARRQPDEVIIVDVSPGGLPFDTEWKQQTGGCNLCGDKLVTVALAILESEGTTTSVYHRPGEFDHTSGQRRFGIAKADNEFVARFDEDTVLLDERHLERCVDRLQSDDGVVGVGCRVAPIRGNSTGRAIARFLDGAKRTPTINGTYHNTYFVIHATHLCPDGEACFPAHRQDDQHLLKHLDEHGEVVRDDELVALTDLPTRKQARALRVGGATAAGGVASALIASALKGSSI